MSNYQKTNPTHGTKNTSTSDPKHEFSGAVIKDSLAADSLRAGGSFSKGNPTGIMDVTADSSTLSRGDDTIGVRRVHESEDGGGHVGVVRVEDEERYQTQGTGKKPMNPHYGQNWDGEDNDYGQQQQQQQGKTGGNAKDRKDDGFGSGIVDKQPEIGSDEDPGRYAEQKFLERNSRDLGVPGGGGGKVEEGNMYDVLGSKNL